MTERNDQVIKMGEIYRNAKEVVVWLGLSDESSDLAIQTLIEVGLVIQNISDDSSYVDHQHFAAASLGFHKLHVINTLFYRQYWERLWIIQEVSLVIGLRFYCENRA